MGGMDRFAQFAHMNISCLLLLLLVWRFGFLLDFTTLHSGLFVDLAYPRPIDS